MIYSLIKDTRSKRKGLGLRQREQLGSYCNNPKEKPVLQFLQWLAQGCNRGCLKKCSDSGCILK